MPQTIRQLSLRCSSLCTRWPLQCTTQTGFAFLEERDRAHCKALTPNCFSIAFFTMHFDVEEVARELDLLCFVLDCPFRGSTRSFASPPASMPLSATPFTDGNTEAQRDPRQTGSAHRTPLATTTFATAFSVSFDDDHFVFAVRCREI